MPLIAAAALACGAGVSVFDVNWSIALQEQVPLSLLSRVSSYDAFGSNVFRPLGTALTGPVALALGVTATLAGSGAVILISVLAVLGVADVRDLRRKSGRAGLAAAGSTSSPESP